jgi:UDP-glucose 4-epimerase
MPARPLESTTRRAVSDKAAGARLPTTVGLREGLTEMVEWISAPGPREFDYNLELEIVNELTPRTWTPADIPATAILPCYNEVRAGG